MKPNAMKRLVVRTAVKKAVADVRENPGKNIRRLVDMGELLAGGNYQQEFFRVALAQLKHESSAYYGMATRVIAKADAEYLTEFGVSMAYNALSHGAKTIRKTEQEKGFHVPWCLVIELQDTAVHLAPQDVAAIMQQGEALGVYCYIVRLPQQYPQTQQLMQALAAQKDCAVLLLVDAQLVTPQLAGGLLAAKNIGAVLNMDAPSAVLQAAADTLLNSGCIAGGFCQRPSLAAADVNAAMLQQADALGLAACVVVRQPETAAQATDAVYDRFVAMREQLTVPVFPIDMYMDITVADRAISGEGCAVVVKADGGFVFANADKGRLACRFNMHSVPLQQALRQCLPMA